jgi:hypothetical protein
VADNVTGYESAQSQMPNATKLRSLGGKTNEKDIRFKESHPVVFNLIEEYIPSITQ